ncbi:MAG: DUF445 family protein [Firmicutes bacterium]|nr:DUF445 family protein [Bacillota bacterium]
MIDYLSPIIGGIIGYFTNWLAIKMLFWPNKAIYIGSFKVPMTPGLIYKERGRIAKKMSSVTAKYVLNGDSMDSAIKTQQNYDMVKELILSKKGLNIKELLGENYEPFLGIISVNLKAFLKKRETFDNIFSKIWSIEIPFNEESVNKWLIEEKNVERLQKKFIDYIKNKKISDIISDDKDIFIKEIVDKSAAKLNEEILTNVSLNEKLRNIMAKVIDENVGKFAGLFINSDRVYDSIIRNFSVYLLSESGREDIYNYIINKKNENIGDMMLSLGIDSDVIISEEMITSFVSSISSVDFYKSDDFRRKASEFLYRHYIQNIDMTVDMLLSNIAQIKPLAVFDLNPAFIDTFSGILIDKICDIAVKNINIEEIVENQINSFDMELLEKIILSIVKKELNLITVLGGILGFIIGLIPLIIKLV